MVGAFNRFRGMVYIICTGVDKMILDFREHYKHGMPVHYFSTNSQGFSLVRDYRYDSYHICYTDDLVYEEGILYLPLQSKLKGMSFNDHEKANLRFSLGK